MRPALQGPALLLKAADRGEDDRLLTLLTPEHGRLTALARHARGSKRRFGAALQPFCLFHATLRPSGAGLVFLEQALAAEFPLGNEPGLEAMAAGWLFLELAEQLCPQSQPQAAFFELVLGGLRRLGLGKEGAPAVRLSVLWQALALEGWAPDPCLCMRCGQSKPLTGLSPGADGGICAGCWRPLDGPRVGEAAAAAWMAVAQGRPPATTPPEAEAALRRWVAHHTGRDLRSGQLEWGAG
jgi:DNA repair protein RecO (recombination protein O)